MGEEMKQFYDKFLYCIKNPRIWLIVSYMVFFYFFCGWWGQIIVQLIIGGIIFWAIINLFDHFIFDPILQKIIEREKKRERERLHELTPRIR